MNMQPLISVIVPAYNIEAYIGECLDSILNQTYRKLEIIVVDDGSTDNTGKIVDEYASKDNRIKIIHKKNGGLSSARNAGLNISSGDYISFIDGDDLVTNRLYQDIVSIIEVYPSIDLIYFPFCSFVDGCNISLCDQNKDFGKDVLSISSFFTKTDVLGFFVQGINIQGVAWNKIYKRTHAVCQRFFEGKAYEDAPFVLEFLFRCKNICFIPNPYYCYRKGRLGQITQTFTFKLFDEYDIQDSLIEKYRDDVEKVAYIKAYRVEYLMHCYTDVSKSNSPERKGIVQHIEKLARENRHTKLITPFGKKYLRYKLFLYSPKVFGLINKVMRKLKSILK